MTWLFDSHIHLSDPEYQPSMIHIIRNMERMQIKACCVSVDFQTSKISLGLSKKSKLVMPFLGVHPEKAHENLDPILDLIQKNSENLSGIGEIGLDRTYVNKNKDYQRQEFVFKTQLSLAEKLKKPVSIHSRKTLDDIFDIITSYSIDGILLHWFDGNKQQLRKAMDMGMFVSYGPVMVYAKDKQGLLSKTDNSKILVETDGPVRFSKCFGLKPAQISFLPSVIFCASKVLGISYDDMAITLEQNSKNYLKI